MLAVIGWAGIIIGTAALFGATVPLAAAATAGLIIYSIFGLIGALFTYGWDNSADKRFWFVSFLVKWAQSPIITTIGLIVAAFFVAGGNDVDFRRGMLFVEVGPGEGALTLGAIAWTRSCEFQRNGTVRDALAQHEAHHSRTIAAIGELGFYFTYVVVGGLWAGATSSLFCWNDINTRGNGNPFEKTAHTYTNDNGQIASSKPC